jgi:hypothetical protein
MTQQACNAPRRGATVSKRELRALAKRLAASATPELRAVARALDKALAGEAYSQRHHEGDDYDPARCAACEADLWVAYAIGIALADVDAGDLYALIGAYQGLSLEDFARELERARDERGPPDILRAWLTLADAQREELHATMHALGYPLEKWEHPWGHRWHWYGDVDDAPSHEAAALIAELKAEHARASRAFSGGGPIVADPALLNEIRFGAATVRKARRTQFATGKGIDPSWLL